MYLVATYIKKFLSYITGTRIFQILRIISHQMRVLWMLKSQLNQLCLTRLAKPLKTPLLKQICVHLLTSKVKFYLEDDFIYTSFYMKKYNESMDNEI